MQEVTRMKKQHRLAWMIGMGMAAAMWLVLFAFADVYFGANDDQFLLRTFTGGAPAGAEGGRTGLLFFLWWATLFPWRR